MFGAVDNSLAPLEQPGFYDVVVVVEGTPFPVVVRKKSDVAGVWVNTSSITFALGAELLRHRLDQADRGDCRAGGAERHAIGFRHIKMTPSPGYRGAFKDYELAAFRAAVIRLKKEQNLYVTEPKDGVTFTGRSLFRSTIALPANVPVGPLVARTYLFRNGEVISAHIARVTPAAGRHRALGAQLRVHLSDELRDDRRPDRGAVWAAGLGLLPPPAGLSRRSVFLEQARRDGVEPFLAEHPHVHAVVAEQRLEGVVENVEAAGVGAERRHDEA